MCLKLCDTYKWHSFLVGVGVYLQYKLHIVNNNLCLIFTNVQQARSRHVCVQRYKSLLLLHGLIKTFVTAALYDFFFIHLLPVYFKLQILKLNTVLWNRRWKKCIQKGAKCSLYKNFKMYMNYLTEVFICCICI